MGTNIQEGDSSVDADFFIEKRRKWISQEKRTSFKCDSGGGHSSKDDKSSEELKSTGFGNGDLCSVSSFTCDSSSSPLSQNKKSSKRCHRLSSLGKATNNNRKSSPVTLSPDTTVPECIFRKKVTSSDSKISDDVTKAIKDKNNSVTPKELVKDDDSLTNSRLRSEVYIVPSLDSNLRKEGKSVTSSSEKYSKTRREKDNSVKPCKCKVERKLEDLRKKFLEIKRSSSETSASSSLSSSSSSSSSYSSSSCTSSSSRDYKILSKLMRIPKSYQKYRNRPDSCLSSDSSCQRHRSKSPKSPKNRTRRSDQESDYDLSVINTRSIPRNRFADCANCCHCYRHIVDRKSLHAGHGMATPLTSKPYPSWNIDCKVYIGGLDKNTTRKEIRNIFLKYGRITNLWIAKKPPGFAFVEYASTDEAKEAVRRADGMTTITGNKIRVQKSKGLRRLTSKKSSGSRHKHRSLPY